MAHLLSGAGGRSRRPRADGREQEGEQEEQEATGEQMNPSMRVCDKQTA